jgi:glycosyltransferase involved in cell wall biosynthesis
MTPKVTIGVVTKNCEKYIGGALESIRNQDFPHDLIEVIFVDESEDSTLSIVQNHVSKCDIPAKVFHVSGTGLGHARNMVWANASGEFVIWVDGDMTFPKDFVSRQVKFMEEHPSIGIARGRQALLQGGNLLATLETYSRAAGRMVDYGSPSARTKVIGTGGAIYRTSLLSQVKGFDENIKGYGEDWDIEMRARALGWSMCLTDAEYSDYERLGITWRDLYSRYWRRGRDTYFFTLRNAGVVKHYRMIPPAAVLTGLLHAEKMYKMKKEAFVFLLPLQYLFKWSAWYIGYINARAAAKINMSARSVR